MNGWTHASAAATSAARLGRAMREGSDGFLFDVGTAQPIGGDPPEADTWYHLEMRIDWETRIARLSVDGTEILDGELEGTSNAIARIDLFTVEDATSYFDEIEVVP